MSFCKLILLLNEELLDEFECIAAMTDRVLDFRRDLSESLFVALGLEHGVPSEHVLTTGLTDCAIAAASENDGLSIGTLAKGEDALCVSCFVIEVLNHFPETFATHISEEVLAIRN